MSSFHIDLVPRVGDLVLCKERRLPKDIFDTQNECTCVYLGWDPAGKAYWTWSLTDNDLWQPALDGYVVVKILSTYGDRTEE